MLITNLLLIKQQALPPAPPPKKVVLVPESKHQFFEPVSWARLEPGTEVPSPVANSKWLLQKHQESLADFTDVTPTEREMCMVWDAFILHKSITSEAYLPRAWLDFVKEKASWLVASKARMLEFAKHYAYLLGRDVLDDTTAQRGFRILHEAREAGIQQSNGEKGGEEPKVEPKGTQPRKSAGGCPICGLPVLGASLLLCGDEVCRHSQGPNYRSRPLRNVGGWKNLFLVLFC